MTLAAGVSDTYLLQRRRLERLALQIVGCPHAAADVTQDAWTHATLAAQPIRDPAGFLHRITRNLALDWLRRRRHEAVPLHLAELVHLVDVRPGPERIVCDRQALGRVHKTIAALPPRCRDAFMLARLDGLSYAVIGERLGISPRTVENHIAVAMLRLRHAVRDSL